MSYTQQLIILFNENKQDHPEWVLDEEATEELQDAVHLEEQIFTHERRWVNVYEFIYHIPAERAYVRVKTGLGKTEDQDYNEIYSVDQVYPQEKRIVEYVTKEDLKAKTIFKEIFDEK